MAESSSFTSLLALIDNHLSKTCVQGSRSDEVSCGIQIPSLSGIQSGSQSDTKLSLSPGQRLPIPSLTLSGSPIQNVLAEQVANMLKAKEKKKKNEEEQQRIAEEIKKMKLKDEEDSSDCVIDLMAALRVPCKPEIYEKIDSFSKSSSSESLFEPKFIDCDIDPTVQSISPEPLLPCITDMSYILTEKIPGGKCSPFGKVLISRLRPVAAPYLRSKYKCDIVKFDFSSKSPCDLIKEKLKKPTSYNTYQTEFDFRI